eukprot:TRINITY_DN7242_c0_g1_i1.p1 TRINITY_DN7242_c0_g1~~TRINITY_DN7242_c0_g1_i1.p1  ORF type:complete len:267 (-),score=44.72 TRINITY_DN7242_c0_g1_i1:137-937(-)
MASTLHFGLYLSTAHGLCHQRRGRPFRRPNRLRVYSDYSCLQVKDVSYRAPGTQHNLLNQVSLSLRGKSLGLVYGRSGSGKTTLLQVLSGLAKPTSGSIFLQKYGIDGVPKESPETLPSTKVGLVFQFPERYFLADSVFEELTFGWPRNLENLISNQTLTRRLHEATQAVGLGEIPWDLDPHSLSGGFKRRLALAVQLIRMPDILLLDEPLAGLDWKARIDVAFLLGNLKKERTLIVVSHDLREILPLVDRAWKMEMGGHLVETTI